MGTLMDKIFGEPNDPIEQLRGGDRQALATLFEKYRDRLRRMVELRLEQRLRARIDASDVVQEALPIDREVLALRHFEQPSRAAAALVLKIRPEAGAKRSFRALKRLKDILATMPDGGEGP